jgi:predicted RNA-binding Zn ribbon-like protein
VASEGPAWVLPDEPSPVRLMNTIWADAAGVHDDLRTESGLRDWLAAVTATTGLPQPSRDELRAAVRLRDGLRRLAALHTKDDRKAAASPTERVTDAIAAINSAIGHLPHVVLALDGESLQKRVCDQGSPIQTALARIAIDGVELLTPPGAEALRACHAPGCVLYFVKSHPRRQWCSDACGNRVRAARHYQRTRDRRTNRSP